MSKIYLQEKLVGEPGQVVGFDADGKAVVEDNIGQGGIGVNLHDNWYFRAPINQLGNTSYTAAGYTIDRWILSNPGQGITLGDDGITVLSAGAGFSQRMEGIAVYAGQPITLSMLLADGTLHAGTVATIEWALETPQTAFDDDVMSCTITQIATDVCEVTYTMKAAGLVLVAAKMELGTVQTLARQEGDAWVINNPPPKFAEELVNCRRYLRVYDLTNAIFAGHITASKKHLVLSGTPFNDMRTRPTISIKNVKVTIRTVDGYSNVANDPNPATATSADIGDYNYFGLYFNNQELGPNNTPCAAQFRAGKLILDANL